MAGAINCDDGTLKVRWAAAAAALVDACPSARIGAVAVDAVVLAVVATAAVGLVPAGAAAVVVRSAGVRGG